MNSVHYISKMIQLNDTMLKLYDTKVDISDKMYIDVIILKKE